MRHVPAIGLGAAVLAVAAAGAGPPALSRTSALALPRAVHSATLLPDGRVLVAGGCTTFGCENSVRSSELFVPRTNRFMRGPPMRTPRVGQLAVLLRSGEVLVVGGWTRDQPTASAELFDAKRNRFFGTGSMRTPRGGFSATLLKDGRVLIVGGTDKANRFLASAEIYDPSAQAFTPTGSMTTARTAHAAARLPDGRVAVFGGSSSRDRVERSIEVWTPATGRFTSGGRMTIARHKHAAVTLADGRVLVVGGSSAADSRERYRSAELYEPRTQSSQRVRSMHGARYKIPDAVLRLAGGGVLVAGGSRLVERYDARTRRFRIVGRVSGSFSFSSATKLRDGRVLITGGYDDAIAPTRASWIYGPSR